MYISIDVNDLKKVNQEFNNNYKKNRIKAFKRTSYIHSCILVMIILALFSIYLIINNTSILYVKKDFIIISMVMLSFCLVPIFIVINKLNDKNFSSFRYKYLLDQFFINIDSEKKELLLMSKKTSIKVNLIKGNIKISNDILLLYNNKNIIAIIPLYKLMNKKYLLDRIKENVEVIKYGD